VLYKAICYILIKRSIISKVQIMKKYLCIILTLSFSILLNFQIGLAVSEIAVTEEMVGKIAYPYNRALQNGTWKLLEYVENEDGSIEYAMQLNEETVSTVKQQREGDKYILEISENGMENIMTVDVDAEEKQIEYEQQIIQEVQGKNNTTEKNIINEKIIFVSGIVVFLLIKLFVRFNK